MTTFTSAPKIHTVRWLFWADGFTPTPGHIFLSHRLWAHQVEALLEHELVHVSQMQAHGWFTWARRYAFSRTWRLAYEVEAYVTSIEAGPFGEVYHTDMIEQFGYYLSKPSRYWLFMPRWRVVTLLTWAFQNRHDLRAKAVCMAELVHAQHTGQHPTN